MADLYGKAPGRMGSLDVPASTTDADLLALFEKVPRTEETQP